MSAHEEVHDRPQIVDLRDDANVQYWCAFWSVSRGELQRAVAKVGNAAPAVAFALGKEAYSAADK